MHEPAGAGRWLVPLARHPWYFAITAIAAIGLLVGGAAMLLAANGTPSHQAASGCGLVNCGSVLPGPAPTISTQSHISRAHVPVSHSPEPPPPTPTPSQAPAPAPAANVEVTLTSDRDRRDFDHFHDQLTLVNNGSSPVSGWTVQLTFPEAEIDSVDTQGWRDGVPFDHWQFSGDTLTISADTDRETLAPGEPLDVTIHGRGRTASPTGCTLNGATCPTLMSPQDQPSVPQDQPSVPQYQQPSQDQPSWLQEQPGQDQQSWQRDRQRSWPDRWHGGWR